MVKPWAPAYGQQYTAVLAALGTQEHDTNPDGMSITGRTFRIYNAGANLMFFAFTSKTGTLIGGALPGVPLAPGASIYVYTDNNNRYLITQSTLGTTYYANSGQEGAGGGT